MSDTDIFNLWDRERALHKDGKWPDGAPGLLIEDWYQNAGRWTSEIDGLGWPLEGNDLDAALWRIMQFVAWDFVKRGTPSRNTMMWHVGGSEGWAIATPDDWIAEAGNILTRLEAA